MLVKDVMTKAPTCCRPEDKLDSVAMLMLEQDCGEIPVWDGTRLVGVITDRDITCRAVSMGRNPGTQPVSEVMTKSVFTVQPENDLDSALALMETKQIRRVPVLDKAGRLVGIVSLADLTSKLPAADLAATLKAVSARRMTLVTA